jgi:hypothetical protein
MSDQSKDYQKDIDRDAAESTHLENTNDIIRRIQTSGSITITPELFEKIYLAPQNAVKGDLRKTFGNPTPL